MKLVIQNTARVWGGNEKSLATLARGLSARGHEVIVSCAKGVVSERMTEMGITATHFRPRGILDVASGASFAWWVRREAPDALLLTSWNAFPWAAWAGKVAGIDRIVLRQGIVRTPPSKGFHAYTLRHWVDAVITNAPEIKEEWLRSIPEFSRDNVHVVLNAVAPTATDRAANREMLRRELGVDENMLLISAAGILSPRKNFELLLEAFARIQSRNAHVVIIGDGSHRSSLEHSANALGIESVVHFLGARDNAARVIGGSDVFVLSSRNEGMANVMLEAMAAGVPVIASDISGVRTAIGAADGRKSAGWIFPADDVSALAAALEQVLADLRDGGAEVELRTREALWRIDNWFSESRMLDHSERILFG